MTKKYVSLEHAIRNAVRDQQYKKVNEDFEFEMARNELRTAIDAAKRLMTQLDGEGELEAWVQSKITKGSDYLDTVADYMDSRDTKKLKEEKSNNSDDDETEAKKSINAKYPTLNKIGDWVGNTITDIEKNIPSASEMRKKTANVLGTEAPTPEDEKELNKREGAAKGAAFVGSALLPGSGLLGKGMSAATGLAKSGASKILKSKPSSVVPKKVETPKVDIPDQVGKPSNVNSAADYITKTGPKTGASDNIPSTPKAPKAPEAVEPKLPEPSKGGKRDAANQNTEAEQLGTGTTGLAPKPKKSGSPEKIEPYKTGVEINKKGSVPEAPKNDNLKKANDNTPGKKDVVPQGTPKPFKQSDIPGVTNKPSGPAPAKTNPIPSKAPAKAPEPVKAPESKPNPATERVLKPAGFPEPTPYSNPKPDVSPAQAKSSPAPSPAPAQAKSSPEPAPSAKPNAKPNTKKKVVPPPFGLPGGGKYKEPPSHTEYHNVPVQTSVSQARAHRVFKEEKLASIVKSVVKKKKEEKEGGPNPMVDFEPKLNHKYDNET